MRALYILLMVKLLSIECEGIGWSDIQPEPGILTNNKSRSVEIEIRKSLVTTTNWFAAHHNEIQAWANGAILATAAVPIVPTIISVATGFASLFEEQSDWKDDFTRVMSKVLTQVVQESQAQSFISNIRNRLTTLKDRFFPFMKEVLEQMAKKDNGGNIEVDQKNETAVTNELQDIISQFSDTINEFTNPKSNFKNNPLIAAPFLIELGVVISFLEPIAMRFTPFASAYKISCQIRDAMMDYFPFVVGARLEKLNAPLKIMKKVRTSSISQDEQFQEVVVASRVHCNIKCDGGEHEVSESGWNQHESNCLIDEFSTKILGRDEGHQCEQSYAKYLRYRVEKMFPIKELNQTCNRLMGNPTGFGWATVKLKMLHAFHLEDPYREEATQSPYYMIPQTIGNSCDGYRKGEENDNICDPFVVVRINGTEYPPTVARENTQYFDVDEIFTSDRIQKNLARIEITVYDHNKNRKHEVILRTEGTVDDFINDPFRCSPNGDKESFHIEGNCLEVDVIWQPKREKTITEISRTAIKEEQQSKKDEVYFNGGYAELKDHFEVGTALTITFDIKPRTLNCLLLSAYGQNAMFVLQLINGVFNLTVDNGDGPFTALYKPENNLYIPENGQNFCDGQWHNVTVVKSKEIIQLTVDGISSSPAFGSREHISTDTTSPLYLGSHPNIDTARGLGVHTPFIGCMRNIKIPNVPNSIDPNKVNGAVQFGGCPYSTTLPLCSKNTNF